MYVVFYNNKKFVKKCQWRKKWTKSLLKNASNFWKSLLKNASNFWKSLLKNASNF